MDEQRKSALVRLIDPKNEILRLEVVYPCLNLFHTYIHNWMFPGYYEKNDNYARQKEKLTQET